MSGITVVDNFYEHPEQLRASALQHDFAPVEYKGVTYHGIAAPNVLKLEDFPGMRGRCKTVLSFFRLTLANDPVTTFIHADSDEADYAAVLYLNTSEQCRGGTAFWQHLCFGDWHYKNEMPSTLAKQVNSDGMSDLHWKLNRIVTMQFNRLLTYPGNLFHSRWPKEGFGTNKNNGRLIYAAFYNLP